MTEPTQDKSGSVQDTTGDTIPPGATSHIPLSKAPTSQISRLKAYLEESFPHELDLTNLQHPEAAADTAIRLLKALSAHAGPGQVRRCGSEYCNKPTGHLDVHGWVHSG